MTSLGTITDEKSKDPAATAASLKAVLSTVVELSDVQTIYVVSDSPSNQYRNKKMVYLEKIWAVKHRIDVLHIYNERGNFWLDNCGAISVQ